MLSRKNKFVLYQLTHQKYTRPQNLIVTENKNRSVVHFTRLIIQEVFLEHLYCIHYWNNTKMFDTQSN